MQEGIAAGRFLLCSLCEGPFHIGLGSMSSLADLPEIVGFFSYSREDDVDSHGALSALRTRIQGGLRGQLGRSAKAFRLWQDKEAIPSGTLWESEIKNAVAQSVFFIPIITPTVVASRYCRFELESFLARSFRFSTSTFRSWRMPPAAKAIRCSRLSPNVNTWIGANFNILTSIRRR
jgi:hypothetical protein